MVNFSLIRILIYIFYLTLAVYAYSNGLYLLVVFVLIILKLYELGIM